MTHWFTDQDLETFELTCLSQGVPERELKKPDGALSYIKQARYMPYSQIAKGFVLAAQGLLRPWYDKSRYLQAEFNRLLDIVDPLPE